MTFDIKIACTLTVEGVSWTNNRGQIEHATGISFVIVQGALIALAVALVFIGYVIWSWLYPARHNWNRWWWCSCQVLYGRHKYI